MIMAVDDTNGDVCFRLQDSRGFERRQRDKKFRTTKFHKERLRLTQSQIALDKARRKLRKEKSCSNGRGSEDDFYIHLHLIPDKKHKLGPFVTEDPILPAGAEVFKYNSNKPRRYADNKSLRAEYRRIHGQKLPSSYVVHHVNHDRADPRIDNMHICVNEGAEKKLHGQLIQFITEMINAGFLLFNKKLGIYYVEDPHITARLKENKLIAKEALARGLALAS